MPPLYGPVGKLSANAVTAAAGRTAIGLSANALPATAITQTYSTASTTVANPTTNTISDSGGGAVSTSALAAQTLPTALTDNGGGTANGTVEAQSTFAASVGWNGTNVYPSAADESALTAIALAARNNMKEATTTFAAIRAQLAVIQATESTLAAELALTKADLLADKKVITSIIDALQTMGILA